MSNVVLHTYTGVYHSVCHASTMSRPGIHCVETQCPVLYLVYELVGITFRTLSFL